MTAARPPDPDGPHKGEKIGEGIDATASTIPSSTNLLAECRRQLREDVGMCAPCASRSPEPSSKGPYDAGVFRSAVNNFGVRELLQGVAEMAPSPRPQPAVERTVSRRKQGRGLRVQDRSQHGPSIETALPFVRMSSATSARRQLTHVRSGRSSPSRTRSCSWRRTASVPRSLAGDIVGIPNYGNLRIGDALTEG